LLKECLYVLAKSDYNPKEYSRFLGRSD